MLQYLVPGAALGFLGLLSAYLVQLLYSEARTLRLAAQSAKQEHDLLAERIGLVMDQRGFEGMKSALSWNGYRKFQVVRKVIEAEGVCSCYLEPHDGKPLPQFKPGQYLTFQLHLPNQAKPVIRCYSLSEGPHERRHYRVTVKKVLPPADAAGAPGLSSSYFYDKLREGDILDVKAPGGHFYLDLSQQSPVVLIGGGIGITPVLSMLNAIVASGSRREVWFFLGVRNRSEHVLKEHLERIAKENDNVRLRVCYSRPGKDDVLGTDYHHAGRVGVELFRKELPSNNYEFYLCGPGPMMTAVTEGLRDWGVPDRSVFFESFGSASVKSIAPAAEAGDSAHKVRFGRSGKDCAWTPGTASLLDLAAANGVSIESGCRAGNCGTCLVAVKSGKFSYLTEPGFHAEKGSCLTCISVPKGDLELDA